MYQSLDSPPVEGSRRCARSMQTRLCLTHVLSPVPSHSPAEAGGELGCVGGGEGVLGALEASGQMVGIGHQ